MEISKVSLKWFYSLFLIVIVSCTSEDAEYPKIFKYSGYTEKAIRVYTRNGEVPNSTAKSSYISKYEESMSAQEELEDLTNISFSYLNSKKVFFITNGVNTFDTLNVFEDNGLIYWEKQYLTTTTMPSQILNMLAYKPLYQEVSEIEPDDYMGEMSSVLEKECFYLIPDGKTLLLPFVKFRYQKYLGEDHILTYEYYCNNRFNSSCVLDINEKDTIIVCEYKYIYK